MRQRNLSTIKNLVDELLLSTKESDSTQAEQQSEQQKQQLEKISMLTDEVLREIEELKTKN